MPSYIAVCHEIPVEFASNKAYTPTFINTCPGQVVYYTPEEAAILLQPFIQSSTSNNYTDLSQEDFILLGSFALFAFVIAYSVRMVRSLLNV